MKTTIDMAREAGYMRTVFGGAEISMASIDCLKDFEALVRADEREACANVCESKQNSYESRGFPREFTAARACANAIRARGNT
jgi:hypothetical protein